MPWLLRREWVDGPEDANSVFGLNAEEVKALVDRFPALRLNVNSEIVADVLINQSNHPLAQAVVRAAQAKGMELPAAGGLARDPHHSAAHVRKDAPAI